MMSENHSASRRDNLSPAKRALLEKRLGRKLVQGCEPQVISKRPQQSFAPVSLSQERMLVSAQVEGSASRYIRVARLKGSLNVAVLEQTLNQLIERHETLRTTFDTVEGQIAQIVNPPQPQPLPVLDFCGLDEEEQEARIKQMAEDEEYRTFDLAGGPLFRATLIKLKEDEHVLLFSILHIICDNWSLRILIREIATLYVAISFGQPLPLAQLPIQFGDLAYWQRQRLQGDALEVELSYWRQRLAGHPPVLELPTDRPRPPVQTFRGEDHILVLPKSLYESLKELSQREENTLFITMLAAFKALLYRYSGQPDIVIGAGIAARNLVEIEGLIGPINNTVALRTDLSGNPGFRELLRRVRETTLGAFAHQEIPLEKLLEELGVERNPGYAPLFQVGITLQTEHYAQKAEAPRSEDEALALPGLLMTLSGVSRRAALDLTLRMQDSQQGLACSLEYNPDLFDSDRNKRMLEHFQVVLESIVADPEKRISDLPLLIESECEGLLAQSNETGAAI